MSHSEKGQHDLFENEAARSLLDRLRLYSPTVPDQVFASAVGGSALLDSSKAPQILRASTFALQFQPEAIRHRVGYGEL